MPYQARRHDHLWVRLGGGTGFVFSDPRRFGLLDLAETEKLDAWPAFRALGPEPLEREFTGKALMDRLKGRKAAIKPVLMNQSVVVGVGNIYASEALFDAGISPLRAAGRIGMEKAGQLCTSVKKVLRASIRAGGSSLKDYRDADGNAGFFQNRFNVYNREGQACPGCVCDITRTGGIRKITQAGRSTFYCPRKQT
jgi:formamidopyrimidine-DNA glycosylase